MKTVVLEHLLSNDLVDTRYVMFVESELEFNEILKKSRMGEVI